MGGVTAVFEMPNTKPLTTTAADARRQGAPRARDRMLCDFAFYVGGTRENVDDIPALERLEASAGIKVFMGSSTGDLLVEDEPSLDRIIARISRRAAFHSEDEARLKARSRPAPARRSLLASGLARRGGGADRDAAAGAAGREAREARARAARLDRRGDGVPGRAQGLGQRRGDAASSHAGGARLLRAARHLCADESAGARRSASPGDLGGARRAASSTCWAPTTRRIRARRRITPIRRAIPA